MSDASGPRAVMDGNEAVAQVAYRVNEVCAIFPITPSSPMAELADEWAAAGRPNLWGTVPVVQEMQSEAGAAGALHGALQAGALTTTFTASQGLLLMIPNMYKIAGELSPCVFHVAARSVATHALSIFGDHSDVMATRATGFALLSAGSVQEAHDGALISQLSTLRSRIPFVHFFDGFRTSHELNTLQPLSEDQMRAMLDEQSIRAHRARALNPEHPFIRGTAQNPDTFFQGRERINPFYAQTPQIVQAVMDEFAALTGRRYRLFDYDGGADAERVIILMGSAAETARAAAAALRERGERVGVLQVRLYRPFAREALRAALPASCRAIAVLERTKEPGAPGEPLYLDVVEALRESSRDGSHETIRHIIGGRFGLASKDFTPAMAKAVFDELASGTPRYGFTVGIDDDLSHTSLSVDHDFPIEPPGVLGAVFYGLGADGTVGANKNSVRIIAGHTGLHAQGYFVYDSHKAGARTVSHLRFGPSAIRAPYLLSAAAFVACHEFGLLFRQDVLRIAATGATVLLNSPYDAAGTWRRLPRPVQQQILGRRLRVFVIDATRVAAEAGLSNRTNTVLQTCFFALAGILPREQAIGHIKQAIRDSYAEQGETVVEQNFRAVEAALAQLHELAGPLALSSGFEREPAVPSDAPAFVREITARMLEERGDEIPVSALPADGTYPSGTAVWEKRNIASDVPQWNAELCVQCGQCAFVCPHSVIRARYFNQAQLQSAPATFRSAPINARGYPGIRFSLQIYVEDCTGCGQCIEACPAHSPADPQVRALQWVHKAPELVERERAHIGFFERLPVNDRSRVDFANVRGVQFLQPLFEFPGACAGCGETPYLKLLSQLFGDRLMIANATGCSSIYGANLPTTPWSVNHEGRGPAWSNSLFEDAAEFGFGFRLASDRQLAIATRLLRALAGELGEARVEALLSAPQARESQIREQRARVAELKRELERVSSSSPMALELLPVLDQLIRRSIWIVGGDGWAYDIGSGGLDHVLASGRDINVLVLDTQVYSNTGGQASKATPLAAIARFAAAGKRVPRKDLALQAISYGNVYVAQVAMGANPQQTLEVFREAEAYPGPSLILAYSHCIAHGFDLRHGMRQQQLAAASGYWPLFRYDPALRAAGQAAWQMDSPRATCSFEEFAYHEARFRSLASVRPAESRALLEEAQRRALQRYRTYERLAALESMAFDTAQPVVPSVEVVRSSAVKPS
jgi:pyruvate-ferredoxin/flavodoxin oxidoreductase